MIVVARDGVPLLLCTTVLDAFALFACPAELWLFAGLELWQTDES